MCLCFHLKLLLDIVIYHTHSRGNSCIPYCLDFHKSGWLLKEPLCFRTPIVMTASSSAKVGGYGEISYDSAGAAGESGAG